MTFEDVNATLEDVGERDISMHMNNISNLHGDAFTIEELRKEKNQNYKRCFRARLATSKLNARTLLLSRSRLRTSTSNSVKCSIMNLIGKQSTFN